jgi:cyclopropane-fatty-acyl-phospholipid synthase
MQLCIYMLSRIRCGVIHFILPDGTRLRFEGDDPGPEAALYVHKTRVLRRFVAKGRLGFCEAYLDGDWSSPDIASFFEAILVNADAMHQTWYGKRWYRVISWLARKMRTNTKRRARRNIYAHYDIGNDFYAAWLDNSMTYSAALFENDNDSLETAQKNKYAELCRRLDIRPGQHVLEIGCGWGGLAEHIARHYEAHVTAVTISQAQYDYARQRIEQAGLSPMVDIRLCDYRDIEGEFERIASIEMFEAVGEEYWPTFFNHINGLLQPGGRAELQVITIRDDCFANYRASADYIQHYIFPGGMLPSKQVLDEQVRGANLVPGDHIAFGKDYAKTLQIWNNNFQQAWPGIEKDGTKTARFKRLWEQYLAYCQAGFTTGTIDVIQQSIHKQAESV